MRRESFSPASAVTALDHCWVVVPEQFVHESPPVYVIPKMYDEDDFHGSSPVDLPFFPIVHTGSLCSERSLAPLWAILDHALKSEPSLQGKIDFWQVGTIDATIEEEMKTSPLKPEVVQYSRGELTRKLADNLNAEVNAHIS